MDDTLCERFFLQPAPLLQRRYEALRAVFVDHRPMQEVAQQFGYRYGSLRNLVTEFRGQCRGGPAPPFSPRRPAAGPVAVTPPRSRFTPSHRQSPTADNSRSPRGATSAAASPASSCSCPCWHASASIA
jgi:hypothetical protein